MRILIDPSEITEVEYVPTETNLPNEQKRLKLMLVVERPDVERVVRCGECVHYREETEFSVDGFNEVGHIITYCFCKKHNRTEGKCWYCPEGERNDDAIH